MLLTLGAINKNNNQYVYPSIANKKDKYECPECNKELILKQGNKRIHHFSHYATNNPCNYYIKPTESQIHKDAKMLMKTLLHNNTRITVSRICRCCKGEEKYEIPKRDNISNIEIEYRFEYNGTKIADIAFIENKEIICIFEICNTHKTMKENRPEPWFEIDAYELLYKANYNEKSELYISCIRNELCDKCIERNTCNGFGECLLQTDYENKYIKNNDYLCIYNCKPKNCPTKYCDAIMPQWVLNCHGGTCINCAIGYEPIKIILLDVPFDRKNEAKKLGAKWQPYPYKKWVINSNHINRDILLSLFNEYKC